VVTKSISNLDSLKLIDENNEMCYGCNQEWYPKKWQKISGCGPTTACNILLCSNFFGLNDELGPRNNSKESGLSLMEEVWDYITPAENGIPTTGIFCQDIDNYFQSKGQKIVCHVMDIPEEKHLRPGLRDVIDFIEEAVLLDSPVAFLNLCNGEVDELDEWHWVSIVSVKFDEDSNAGYVEIVDGGLIKLIDFTLWYNTTKLGGGLAYMTV
jgi:hypothetical protein